MRIYSMTATFGKLEHQTLTLEPGLNIIHAPNEWGKSTWCAFLVAMLYGIETRVHSTKAALADKERYAPWSGSPMSGRIDLNWNDKDITIERRTKGRSIFGEFRAYETSTGLPLSSFFCTYSWICTWSIDKSNNWPIKFFCLFHKSYCFSITFRIWHSKISFNIFFCGSSFLLCNYRKILFTYSCKATNNCFIIFKISISM